MPALRRRLLVLSLVVLMTASGLIVASNMGVMCRVSFTETGVDHWVSLPYRTELATAEDVCDAIGPEVSLVAHFHTDSETRVEWTCPGGTNFTLQPGLGVVVQVSSPTTTAFLGSHDPEALVPPGGFLHTDRDYIISIPYHATAQVANDLCLQIPAAGTVSRFDPSSGSREDWTCPLGVNFQLRVGEAVRVQVRESSEGFRPEVY